jgi:hypothetical protein
MFDNEPSRELWVVLYIAALFIVVLTGGTPP